MRARRSAIRMSLCLNEGLPQKGKRYDRSPYGDRPRRASMKGFPRRGSDPSRSRTGGRSRRLNEGLPQKGKRSVSGVEMRAQRSSPQ